MLKEKLTRKNAATVLIIVLLVLGGMFIGRWMAPESAYQQMRRIDRENLIKNKGLTRYDLDLLGVKYDRSN